jgi:hypothetical protein
MSGAEGGVVCHEGVCWAGKSGVPSRNAGSSSTTAASGGNPSEMKPLNGILLALLGTVASAIGGTLIVACEDHANGPPPATAAAESSGDAGPSADPTGATHGGW